MKTHNISLMSSAVAKFAHRCQGWRDLLWKGNVINGEQVMDRCSGHAMMADAGDMLRALQRADIIKPIAFSPTLSGGFFVQSEVAYRGKQTKPNAGTAAHWTWEVLIDCP